MITFLALVLSLNSIESQELCSFLKPNGTYEGLGVYKSYKTESHGYYLYNRYGTEWKFNFDRNNVSMFANETRTFDPMIIKWFGIHYQTIGTFPLFKRTTIAYNCHIRSSVILNH